MTLSLLPNVITLLRLVLLFPLSFVLIKDQYQTAVIIFFIAGFSDALDGYLAKRFSWESRFGSIMDPIADKALLVITMAILTINQEFLLSLFVLVAMRDLIIISGAYYYHWRFGPYQMQPTLLSKLNTFIQILLVTSLLFSLAYLPLPYTYLQGLTLICFITTASSGLHYLLLLRQKLSAVNISDK
jgi:cardiolipin synthase (CMP-forming)